MREHLRAGLDELERYGLSGRIEHGGKHPRLVFDCHGQKVRLVCGGTPRCVSVAARAIRQDVRRVVERRGR